MSTRTQRPAPDDAAAFYHGYLAAVPDGDIVETLRTQPEALADTIRGLDAAHRYAPGKWSAAEVVLHMIDSERVFAYRTLRFARGDETPLPGFDQEVFMASVDASDRSLDDLLDEFRTVRAATLTLVESLKDADWDRSGVASGHAMTTRAAIWVTAGHAGHHMAMLRDRYVAATT